MPTTILDNETYPEALQRRCAEESRIDRKIEIIAMAKSAGFFEFNVEGWSKEFERFAALVAAHEREACAKVCETDIEEDEAPWTAFNYAAAIRARNEK